MTKDAKKKIEEKKIEENNVDKVEEKTKEKKIEDNVPKVTPLSLDSKKKIVDEDDDDVINIKGPLNMDSLRSTEFMEFATSMQSHAKKKRVKEQQKEAETIRNAVEILSSLLSETDTDNFVIPINKIGH